MLLAARGTAGQLLVSSGVEICPEDCHPATPHTHTHRMHTNLLMNVYTRLHTRPLNVTYIPATHKTPSRNDSKVHKDIKQRSPDKLFKHA